MRRHDDGRTAGLLAAALVLLAGPARAQEPSAKDICDKITARVGHAVPECQNLATSATDAPPPAGTQNPLPDGGCPPGTHVVNTQRNKYQTVGTCVTDVPTFPTPTFIGAAPAQSDCDNYQTAFDVIGSFTNYAFYMGDTERKTLHGIYIEDASQNAQDASAKASASVSAADGCGDLKNLATVVNLGYMQEFALLTAALKVCAEDKNNADWKQCPGAMDGALKSDEQIRKSAGALDNYLAAVDNGHTQCLSGDDRQFFEEMRLTPCQRSSNWAPGGNRCASDRYGIMARLGQLRKARGLLGKVSSGSALGVVSPEASKLIGQAHDDLTSLHNDTSQDNRMLFNATFKVFAMQQTMQPGLKFCPQ